MAPGGPAKAKAAKLWLAKRSMAKAKTLAIAMATESNG